MQEQISMCIASVDSKCYDNARACAERKLSGTEEVSSRSLRYDQLRYVVRYLCVNGTTTLQQLLEMAKVRFLALVLSEERHSAANQVRVEDNKHQVESGSQVVTNLDWMVPELCSRCVAAKLGLQGVHENIGGMCVSSKIGQRSFQPEYASDIDECCVTMCDHLNEIFDKTVEKYREVWIFVKKAMFEEHGCT